jgi:hypothetical protein
MTLNLLIDCGGVALRPFVFQLQTTYMNALSDPVERQVREEAVQGITRLLPLGAKIDFLFKDLLRTFQDMKTLSSQETSTSATLILLQPLTAFCQLMSACTPPTSTPIQSQPPSKPSDAILDDICQVLISCLNEREELVRKSAAVCLGHYASLVHNDKIKHLIGLSIFFSFHPLSLSLLFC